MINFDSSAQVVIHIFDSFIFTQETGNCFNN